MSTKKFKLFLLAICLFASLFLIGCNSEPAAVAEPEADVAVSEAEPAEAEAEATEVPPTEEPAPEAERVEIPVAGFSVVPPAGYSVDLSDPEGVQMLAEGATEDEGPFIGIFGGAFGDEMTADDMYEFMVAADETLGEVERLPYDNPAGDGFAAEFTMTEGEISVKGRMVLTLIDGQGTLITGIAKPEDWDAGFGDLLNQVEASIEMFPSEGGG